MISTRTGPVRLVLANLFALGALLGTAQDGTLDLSFNPGAGASFDVQDFALQPDGKVVIVGSFTTYNNVPRNGIARINPSGSLDTGFGTGTGVNGSINTVALQADGKLIIGGTFSTYNGVVRNRIARVNADGTLDTSFDPGTGAGNDVSYGVRRVKLQPDGKILVGGDFDSFAGTSINNFVRLNPDGSVDTSFELGTGLSGIVDDIEFQSDGRIVVCGDFSGYDGNQVGRIMRLSANGVFDETFDVGTGATSAILEMKMLPDDRILLIGIFNFFDGVNARSVARLNADGSLDASLDVGTGPNEMPWDAAVQADGRMVIVGTFTTFNGVPYKRVCRINVDGSIDTTFNPGTGFTDPGARPSVVLLLPSGKLLIGGGFTQYNGSARNNILRLNNALTVGVNERMDAPFLSAYPNPVGHELTVSLTSEIPRDARLRITDPVGRCVDVSPVIGGGIAERTTLDVSTLHQGAYVLSITWDDRSVTVPFVKE